MPAAWTTVKDWALSERVKLEDFQTYVRDNLLYLHQSSGCRIRTTAAFEVEDDTFVPIDFDLTTPKAVLDWNNGSIFQTGQTTRFVPDRVGLWRVDLQATWDANATGHRRLRLRWNDSGAEASKTGEHTISAVSGSTPTVLGGTLFAYVTSTSYFAEVEVRQNSGDTLNLTELRVTWRFLGGVPGAAPTWTTPRTWTDGELVTEAILDTHLSQNMRFLYDRPSWRVKRTVDQNLTSGSLTAISWATGSATFDSLNGVTWSNSSPTRITPGLDGRWLVGAKTAFSSNSAGYRLLQVRANGNAATVVPLQRQMASTGAQTTLSGVQELLLGASDYLELQLQQDSGATLTADGNESPLGNATWFGGIFLGN